MPHRRRNPGHSPLGVPTGAPQSVENAVEPLAAQLSGSLPPGQSELALHAAEHTPQTHCPTSQSSSLEQLESQLVSLPFPDDAGVLQAPPNAPAQTAKIPKSLPNLLIAQSPSSKPTTVCPTYAITRLVASAGPE
jgi:hypothetical protein